MFVESCGSAIRVMSSLEMKGVLRIWIFIHEFLGWPCSSSSGGVMLVHRGTVGDNVLALKHQTVSHFALYQELNANLCSAPRQLRLTVPYSRADASQMGLALEFHEFLPIFYSKTQSC